jgi:hypothetical protein
MSIVVTYKDIAVRSVSNEAWTFFYLLYGHCQFNELPLVLPHYPTPPQTLVTEESPKTNKLSVRIQTC